MLCAARVATKTQQDRSLGREAEVSVLSGWRDSNPRPLDPQACEGRFWAFVGVRGVSRIWRKCLCCKGFRTLADLCGLRRISGQNR